MPQALYTQNVIAFIWDFDKTLTPGYMQDPLFDAYAVDRHSFWDEVGGLTGHYAAADLKVSRDTAYLWHILSYVRHGVFAGLTNERLRELGSLIPLARGMPDFMHRSRRFAREDARYRRHDIQVEHYVVSTGLRQMILGSGLATAVDGVWGCELLPDPPGPGYLARSAGVGADRSGVLSQVGYTIDNTTKTRAIFEINKGVNRYDDVDVNMKISEEERRVPIRNMIYIADGPSDVPSFSVVNQGGGRTFGVYVPGSAEHYEGVASLQDQGRVHSIAEADYAEGSPADRWLLRALRQIADEVCDARERTLSQYSGAPGHVI
jgi:hypothetical protein